MRSTSLNFARWLDRLGIKHPNQPQLFESVQPVAIVADHRFLISPALGPAGIVGATFTSAVGAFASIMVKTSTPLCVWPQLSSGANLSYYGLQIGPVATAPALAAAVTLTPQPFTLDPPQAFRSFWQSGDSAAVLGAGFPHIRVASTLIAPAYCAPMYVPAGAFAIWVKTTNGAAGDSGFYMQFHEMPGEMAQ